VGGCRSALVPTTYWVTDATGPLAAGEEGRARTWGATLGAAVAAR
jgi:hypothetical protein